MSSKFSEKQEPAAIVVSPTRELAIQTYIEAMKFSKGTMIQAAVVYGGVSVRHQLSQVDRGTDIIVATPGRLIDFVEKGKIGLGKLKYFVLDEGEGEIELVTSKCVSSLGYDE